jgi:hypothetical protein
MATIREAQSTDGQSRHSLYFMSPPARWLDHSTATKFASARFAQVVSAVTHDLRPWYPQERLQAINRRIQSRKQELKDGIVQTIKTPEEWLKIEFNAPDAPPSLVSRSLATLYN